MDLPSINTERLLLSQFLNEDVESLVKLDGDKSVADMTLNVPHPYSIKDANEWISTHEENWATGKSLSLSIRLKKNSTNNTELIGAVGIRRNAKHFRGEIGYWVGEPYRGNSFCTEAVSALIDFSFEHLYLKKIEATVLVNNIASQKVLENNGMKKVAEFKSHFFKNDKFVDVFYYSILRGK